MACKCVDSNGSPADKCIGVCSNQVQFEQEEQRRDPLNGLYETVMFKVEKLIHQEMLCVKNELIRHQTMSGKDEFVDAFKQGMEYGIKLGRELAEELDYE